VLTMIAVGLWGAQLGAPAIWLLPYVSSEGSQSKVANQNLLSFGLNLVASGLRICV